MTMFSTDTGFGNAAVGTGALFTNTSGKHNTALGAYSLFENSTGISNTAVGQVSMYNNQTGSSNTAVGRYSLYANTTGASNTVAGTMALSYNLTGSQNTASGAASLHYNLAGNGNVGLGAYALFNNKTSLSTSPPGPTDTSSSYNTAVGEKALYNNTTGASLGINTGVGYLALYSNAGVGNTAIGAKSGSSPLTGNYNTYVGYGASGISASDQFVTQIGAVPPGNISGTPTTYISGIYNTALSGQPVVVTSSRQLGVSGVSSERFKTDIETMGGNTSKLWQLRPVTFKYKTDATGAVQYGLVAEEVATVYPELVIRDQNGRIDGLHYEELAPMLLNEMQKEHAQMAAKIADQDAKISGLEHQLTELDELKQALNAALGELRSKEGVVAKR
jgi:hypothetical protein